MNKRVIIVVTLSMAVLFGWQFIMARLYPQAPRQKPPAKQGVDREPAWAELKETTPQSFADPTVAVRDGIVLKNAHLTATLTNRSAAIERLQIEHNGALVDLMAPTPVPHFATTIAGESEVATGLWEVVTVEPARVVFSRPLRSGLKIEKAYTLEEKSQAFRVSITISNPTGSPKKVKLDVLASHAVEHDGTYRYDQYCIGYVSMKRGAGYSLEKTSLPDARKQVVEFKSEGETSIDAFGVRNRYFTVAFIPVSGGVQLTTDKVVFQKVAREGALETLRVHAELREFTVETRAEIAYEIYAGRIADPALAQAGHGLGDLAKWDAGCIVFAPFTPIIGMVVPLLVWIMELWHSLFGNWGFAIILTTLVVRLCVFPLTKKSMVGMSKLGELGPQIQLIKDRYPDNPQKQQAEMMKVWKEAGANPLTSGCLPMVLQLPIWMGMYSLMDTAIELRQAPFLFWIRDLSQPDQLVSFGREYSLMFASIDAINLLPVIMTITWFLQAYFAPRSPDPQMAQQQKMFMFMPIMFGLMCYNLASGLSLYFFMNSLFSLAEQKIIKKFWIPKKKEPAKA